MKMWMQFSGQISIVKYKYYNYYYYAVGNASLCQSQYK